jgi:catechol 2,3-dioxygenase-like lactoylglutathione lyase family enzyme
MSAPQLRIARPVSDLARAETMYVAGLGLQRLGGFTDHAGFDGVMLGLPGAGYHFEFTLCRAHPVAPAPTADDLAVFYLPDAEQWEARCAAMLAAGFRAVPSFNPYWDRQGRTFEDADGYRVVLQNAEWPA